MPSAYEEIVKGLPVPHDRQICYPRGVPSDEKQKVAISFLCPVAIVREIDKKASELQTEKIARVHRSDVIKAILAEHFGMDLQAIEEED